MVLFSTSAPDEPYAHRLHYRWSQLEADRWGSNVGSPSCPLPPADREVRLESCRGLDHWPTRCGSVGEKVRFKTCCNMYKTIDYNTFGKNGVLKLTEIELFFLNRHMTRRTCSEWCVVYLGVGNGERFRCLRDEFFPSLTVVAFDPVDEHYTGSKDDVVELAKKWCADGTNYEFLVRCFDAEKDPVWIREKYKGKQLLVISDIRGVAKYDDGNFDKEYDNDQQWRSIQNLRPIESIVKFSVATPAEPFYNYVPGVILKQVFCNYPTQETRLLITGVPTTTKRYDAWELYEKMLYHHEHLRGLVYETSRPPELAKCFDNCFDCSVLWRTLSEYAQKNEADPAVLLDKITKWHVYTPTYCEDHMRRFEDYAWCPPTRHQRWSDVEWYLRQGALMEAVAALEAEDPPPDETPDDQDPGSDCTDGERPRKRAKTAHFDWYDWYDIYKGVEDEQPYIAERLRLAPRPVSRAALIELLGSFSDPFTLVKTSLNGLAC